MKVAENINPARKSHQSNYKDDKKKLIQGINNFQFVKLENLDFVVNSKAYGDT
jgi:hypothetical protein